MKSTGLIAAALLVMTGLARADEPAFLFTRTIEAAIEGEPLVVVRFDSHVFEKTRRDLADVRILDSTGAQVPFVFQTPRTTRPEMRTTTWGSQPPQVKPREDGGLEIVVVLQKDDVQPQGVRILSPLQNFEQRMQVFGSVDGTAWEPVSEPAVLFDYSRYINARNDRVPLRETGSRQFKIVIDNVTAEQESQLLDLTRTLRAGSEAERNERVVIDRRPFRIEGIEFWRDDVLQQVTGDETMAYPVAKFTVEPDDKRQQTRVLFESMREPLTAFTLETSSRNFERRASVEVEEPHGTERRWNSIASAPISEIALLDRKELTLRTNPTRATHYRIVIDNLDSPPLVVTGVKAEGNIQEVVFLAAAGQKYRLAYGAEDSEAPRYDTAAIQAALTGDATTVTTTLGPATPQADAVAAASNVSLKNALNSPRVLIPVLGVLVALLGWGLFHAAKQVETLPHDDAAPPADSSP